MFDNFNSMGSNKESDFTRELEDEESLIKDVKLVGSDGGFVRATKAILAIRSPVFHRMFYGNFQESSKDCGAVRLHYSTPVLRVVIQYCYTDAPNFLSLAERSKDGQRQVTNQIGDDYAVELFQLLDAADYLEMTTLKDLVHQHAHYNLYWDTVIFAIVKELLNTDSTESELWLQCLERLIADERLWSFYPSTGGRAGIAGLSILHLEKLFEALDRKRIALALVKGLKLWQEAHPSCTKEERERLQKLADTIDLQCIPIQELSRLRPCSLFSMERLYKALSKVGKKVKPAPDCEQSPHSPHRKKKSRK